MAMIALELMLNLVQALIFATLTLMFTLAAIEHHGDEEHHEAAHHEPDHATAGPAVRRPTDHSTQGLNPVRNAGTTEGTRNMEHLGAGLAALGVIGPGIGIGILAGLSSSAIGRNPDAAGQIRGLAIILAAFAEGLGVLAVVVGLLAIFIK